MDRGDSRKDRGSPEPQEGEREEGHIELELELELELSFSRHNLAERLVRVLRLRGRFETPEEDSQSQETPVMLDEAPLPRMYIPGQIAHIYAHRGLYKVALVPRSFRDLRKISLSSTLIADHTCKSYYEALLEVRSVRRAKVEAPEWAKFSSTQTCTCCKSEFTWASTSSSEAQEAKDKHHCRACGSLVCHPCSSNRVALSDLGLESPARVCDGCYYDLGRRGDDEGDDEDRDLGSTFPLASKCTDVSSTSTAAAAGTGTGTGTGGEKKIRGTANTTAADKKVVRVTADATVRSESGRRRQSSVVEEIVKTLGEISS